MDTLPTGRPVVGQRPTSDSIHPEERLGVGVVGLHEGHTLLVALQESGYCLAVAGCDLRDEKLAAARQVHPELFCTDDYNEMLARSDVDIVAIYTPDALHAQHIRAAFRAGKHVLCTKPLINSLDDAPELLAAQRATGRRLQVGQSTRFFAPFLRQRAAFERGDLGAVEVVDAHYNHRMDWFYEKSPWALADTDWAFLGLSHPLDLVRWYLGRIEEVHAYGCRTRLGREYGVKGFDAYVVNLRAGDGRIARVLGNYGVTELSAARSMIECLLMGERGTSLAKYPELEFVHLDERGAEVREDYHHALTGYYFRHQLKGMHFGEFANYADYFAKAIIHDTPNSPDLIEGIETVCIMEAVRESARSGRPVALKPLLVKAGLA
ncbi:MAG TPA: Gfo/Idh/MocA family oxidoreductase [Phycisphaerae bacterium]|jgi:predicted dehydrogenase